MQETQIFAMGRALNALVARAGGELRLTLAEFSDTGVVAMGMEGEGDDKTLVFKRFETKDEAIDYARSKFRVVEDAPADAGEG